MLVVAVLVLVLVLVVIAALFSCVCGRKVRNSNIIKEIDLC